MRRHSAMFLAEVHRAPAIGHNSASGELVDLERRWFDLAPDAIWATVDLRHPAWRELVAELEGARAFLAVPMRAALWLGPWTLGWHRYGDGEVALLLAPRRGSWWFAGLLASLLRAKNPPRQVERWGAACLVSARPDRLAHLRDELGPPVQTEVAGPLTVRVAGTVSAPSARADATDRRMWASLSGISDARFTVESGDADSVVGEWQCALRDGVSHVDVEPGIELFYAMLSRELSNRIRVEIHIDDRPPGRLGGQFRATAPAGWRELLRELMREAEKVDSRHPLV